MSIVTFDDYSLLHSKVSQDKFEKAELLAEKEVREVIGPIRWATITTDTFGYDILKDCICNVMDLMQDNEKLSQHIGVTSISNDGYSESYGSEVTSVSLKETMVSSIKSWLSGTGLVGAY